MTEGGGMHQDHGQGNRAKWMDSSYNVEVELMKLINGMYVLRACLTFSKRKA